MPTINPQISTSGDDTQTAVDSSWFSSVEVYTYLGNLSGTSDREGSFRFSSVTIPTGSTINQAYLSMYARNDTGTGVYLKIQVENADNPAAPTSFSDFYSRTVTSDITWTVPSFTSGNWYNTPELKTIVQTVVNRSGFSSGNAMQFFIKDNGSNDKVVGVYMSDQGAGYGFKLYVDYTPQGGWVTMFIEKWRKKLYDKLQRQGAVPLGNRNLLPI